MVANGGDNASVSTSKGITDEKPTIVAIFRFTPPSNDNKTCMAETNWYNKKQTGTWHTTFKSLEVGSNGDSEYNVPQASR